MPALIWLTWLVAGFVGVAVLLVLAFWAAAKARRKGHSWLLFFFLTVFFWPVGVAGAFMVRDRHKEDHRAARA